MQLLKNLDVIQTKTGYIKESEIELNQNNDFLEIYKEEILLIVIAHNMGLTYEYHHMCNVLENEMDKDKNFLNSINSLIFASSNYEKIKESLEGTSCIIIKSDSKIDYSNDEQDKFIFYIDNKSVSFSKPIGLKNGVEMIVESFYKNELMVSFIYDEKHIFSKFDIETGNMTMCENEAFIKNHNFLSVRLNDLKIKDNVRYIDFI